MKHAEDIRDVLRALEGLAEMERIRLLGPDGLIPMKDVPALRARSRYLELDEGRGELAAHAGLEALACVPALRAILLEAQARGLHVSMDSG